MADNKIFCSADEYAWCEKCLKSARRALEFAQNAKPGTAVYESAPKQQAQITLFEEALATFAVRPGSVRSTTGAFTMSVEFQKAFASLKSPKMKFTAIVVDEDKLNAAFVAASEQDD